MKNIAIFASGNGSNAERIATYFKNSEHINVCLILTNNKNAGVIGRANRLEIPVIVFDRNTLYTTNDILTVLAENNIDLIVLAGFLWLIPQNLLANYPNKIINIHPALLPKYGGKGMYGIHVHKAVIDSGDDASGITIHFVNEKYDDGQIIFQKEVRIEDGETPDSLAAKIHTLEYENFPLVIQDVLISHNL